MASVRWSRLNPWKMNPILRFLRSASVVAGHRGDFDAVQLVGGALRWPVQAADHVHERGLAGARRPHHHHHLAGPDLERDAAEGGHHGVAHVVLLAEVRDLDDRGPPTTVVAVRVGARPGPSESDVAQGRSVVHVVLVCITRAANLPVAPPAAPPHCDGDGEPARKREPRPCMRLVTPALLARRRGRGLAGWGLPPRPPPGFGCGAARLLLAATAAAATAAARLRAEQARPEALRRRHGLTGDDPVADLQTAQHDRILIVAAPDPDRRRHRLAVAQDQDRGRRARLIGAAPACRWACRSAWPCPSSGYRSARRRRPACGRTRARSSVSG